MLVDKIRIANPQIKLHYHKKYQNLHDPDNSDRIS